jgi:hypothetical protein
MDLIRDCECLLNWDDDPALREVWLLTQPLSAKWNLISPLRNMTAFRHWGVVVADLKKSVLECAVEGNLISQLDEFGYIHELKRDGEMATYVFRKWRSNIAEKKATLTYVGQTDFTDEETCITGDPLIR